MNFLSHYYLGSNNQDPHFTLGMVLPDLARNHNKLIRFKDMPYGLEWNDQLMSLHKGVKMHHLSDHVFHNSDFFKSKTQELKLLLQSQDFRAMKKHQYFMAHIALELLLDRLLLKKHPTIYEDFYGLLSATEANTISEYFKISGFEANFIAFTEFLKLFNQNKYLQHYTNTESLAFALSRIYRLTTGVDIAKDKEVLMDFIEKGEELIAPEMELIFSLLSGQLEIHIVD